MPSIYLFSSQISTHPLKDSLIILSLSYPILVLPVFLSVLPTCSGSLSNSWLVYLLSRLRAPWGERLAFQFYSSSVTDSNIWLVLSTFFFSSIFISWRLIALQYCSGFCHTLTWISHEVTCISHLNPPSHLPLHPIPLGLPSAPGPSTCLMHPAWADDLFHPR